MGFLNSLGRLIAGKPVFEEPVQHEGSGGDWDSDAPTDDFAEERQAKKAEAKGLYDEHGIKHIPEAAVVHVHYSLSGTTVQVWATIHNQSSRALELDKITLCGQKTELDYPLQPGREHEMLIFKGPVLKNNGYKRAELYYKDVQTGDYFRADHSVGYHFDAALGQYHVNSLEIIRPIHDI